MGMILSALGHFVTPSVQWRLTAVIEVIGLLRAPLVLISRCVLAALDILNTWQMLVDALSASIISLSP